MRQCKKPRWGGFKKKTEEKQKTKKGRGIDSLTVACCFSAFSAASFSCFWKASWRDFISSLGIEKTKHKLHPKSPLENHSSVSRECVVFTKYLANNIKMTSWTIVPEQDKNLLVMEIRYILHLSNVLLCKTSASV